MIVDCCLLAIFELLQAERPLHDITYGLAAAPPLGNIDFLLPHGDNQFFFYLLMAILIF
jgi:hypothetical protein